MKRKLPLAIAAAALCGSLFTGALHGQTLVNHWTLNDLESAKNWIPTIPASAASRSQIINSVDGGSEAYLVAASTSLGVFLLEQDGANAQTGKSIRADGFFERIELGNVSPGASAFTIALWFNWSGTFVNTNAATTAEIISSNNGQVNRWDVGIVRVSGVPTLRVFNDGTAWSASSTTAQNVLSNVAANQWYHLALIRDGSGTFKIYIDGLSVFSGTNNNPFSQDTTKGVWLGRRPSFGDTGFKGNFDDVRVYDGALTEQQLLSIIPEPSTVALLLGMGVLWAAVLKRRIRFRK
jgi:hypothetical protein